MTVTINGSSGITAPEVILDNTTADGGQVVLKSSGYSNWNLDNYSGRFRAYYGSTEYATIDASGNVGIGTSSPSAKLEVNGAIKANGVTLSGYDVVGGGASQYLSLYANSGGPYIVVRGASNGSQGLEFGTGGAERARIDSSGVFYFNSGYGSSAKAYGCRAWVNFNGTGTVAIRGSGNVSSITDNGTGDYTVNFSTAMPDTNYGVTQSCAQQMAGAGGNDNNANFQPHTYSSGSIRGWTSYTDVRVDPVAVNVSVYR